MPIEKSTRNLYKNTPAGNGWNEMKEKTVLETVALECKPMNLLGVTGGGAGIWTPDTADMSRMLWPTELHRQTFLNFTESLPIVN